ncbi:SWIM zinc finger family protein [Nodosilinea nodulosa]|uniref:SWIM zinc finger family protein n=1 Tax=Nodosilinea nodulosa TaxID=416001 RepID=UPI0002E64246|nr:SWIM zinc finger family protein [Nodosilinea nodulosa]
MVTAPPPLKESQVKALATEQSFERGQRYYRKGAIFNPVLQGLTLWADCEGSMTYRPRVTLSAQGIEDSSCTCPYDWGGLCKHQVALLLTYIHDRDRIRVIQPIKTLLAQRSREDLVRMVEQMVQRYPDLLAMVEAPAAPTAGQAPDLDKYRRATARVFQGTEMKPMAAALAALAEHGQRFAQNQDWTNAGDIYQLLLETANDCYDYSVLDIDYNGEVGCVIQDIAQGLSDSLGNAENLDVGRHRLWIETCLNAVFKDIELGGMDYAYPAWDALLTYSTDEDWAWVEKQVRQALDKTGQRTFGSWGREALVKLLADRAERQGSGTDSGELLLELGTPQQRAFYHLNQGNFEEALAIARSHFKDLPGLVIQFADALLGAQATDLAIEFVQECNQKSHFSYQEWLTNFYKNHGQPEQFVAAQIELLKAHFTLQGYQELQAQAEPLGQWKTLRQQLITELSEQKQVTALLNIALLEQDWDLALSYLNQLRFNKLAHQERVAKAIQTDRPGEAIVLYRELAEAAIGQRGRDNYRQAAGHLKAIQRLSKTTQRKAEFSQYVQQLRDRNKTLRALKEELDKAGL